MATDRMDRIEYPGMLRKLQPGQAVDVLHERVRQVGKLNTAIAEWLQERSRLEEQYASGLRRLARKQLEDVDLGIFSVPWTTLTGSMDTLADSHSALAAKIEADVEAPLRAFAASNRDMQAMTTIQGNLASLAKDIERAQQKLDKLQGKGERTETTKLANANSDLDNARVQWDSQAPYVFETLQALDETRVNQLRDYLTQLQTLEVDQVEKSRVAAEQCLNVLLNVETQDEIKTFALRAGARGDRRASTGRVPRTSFMQGGAPAPPPPRGTSASNALTKIPSNAEEDPSQTSTPEPSKKGGLKGLKRLGTVMSRRQSKQPSPLPSTTESPDRKARPFGLGRLGRNKDSYSLDPPQEEPASQRPQSPLRFGSEVMEPPESRLEAASGSRPPLLDHLPQTNGAVGAITPVSSSFPNGDVADTETPVPARSQAPVVRGVEEPQQDHEGFSVPPPQLDPISQAQAALMGEERQEPQFNVSIRNAPIREEGANASLASVATKLQAPPPTQRRAGTVRGRREARNSTVISTVGPPDQGPADPVLSTISATDESAFDPSPVPSQITAAASLPLSEPATSTLVQQPPAISSPIGAGISPAFSPFGSTPDLTSIPGPSSRAAIGTDLSGDNQSIRSGRSTASQSARHPELHQPGLNSSIVETVSARFDNRQVSTASLVGEIALAYNPADALAVPARETIRLDNFSSLDKVAPNPAFIEKSPLREGEYFVSLASLRHTPQIAFKYQLQHEDVTAHVPLSLAPACKIGPSQTDVIISYSLASTFAAAAGVNLSNVTIGIILEGARAVSCMTKPTGTFNRDKNLVFWHLGDLSLTSAPEKLLARFVTEGEATGGSIDAKWDLAVITPHAGGIAVSQSIAERADPFADEDGTRAEFRNTPGVKKLTSGSYVAKF